MAAGANWQSSQNALSTTAEVVAASNSRRHRLTILNLDAAITVYLGHASTVDSTTGFPLAAGASFTFEGPSAMGQVYAVAASGTPSIAILQEFD